MDARLAPARPRSNAYLPFLKGEGVANYLSDPVFRAALARPPEEDLPAAIGHWAYQFSNPTITWADLEWLRDETELPDPAEGHRPRRRRAAARCRRGWTG